MSSMPEVDDAIRLAEERIALLKQARDSLAGTARPEYKYKLFDKFDELIQTSKEQDVRLQALEARLTHTPKTEEETPGPVRVTGDKDKNKGKEKVSPTEAL